MAETTNYGLFVTDDTTLPFKTWRERINATTNSNMTIIDSAMKSIAGSVVATTLSANSWTNSVYSFESQYPFATYNIFIEVNGDSVTGEQLDAWSGAKIVGSSTSNTYKAMGDVPSVDIPIILRVVAK